MKVQGQDETAVLPEEQFLLADLLPGLSGVAEGGRDLGSNVGGPSLLSDNVPQQVDENLVVLQQRHRAVPALESQVGPQRADVDVNLTRILSPAGLLTHRTSLVTAEWVVERRGVGGQTDLRLCDWLTDHRLVDFRVHVLSSSRGHFNVSGNQSVLLRILRSPQQQRKRNIHKDTLRYLLHLLARTKDGVEAEPQPLNSPCPCRG